ncbi:hypothetical protein NP233_g5202 [Leucocoprinus birnbaumii]|uniref:Uncharacterized protein n=1 Tax=Leucocoprinus birnbaumii TaxID=56174 RepID=A0AAD5VVM0_9AGAR|nr:hypothetical protein NP233_g5202 [Leucocoprinus birnbaumii]
MHHITFESLTSDQNLRNAHLYTLPPSPSPEDHTLTLSSCSLQPTIPKEPNYGFDSLFGLLASFVTVPLYLYASQRGKSRVWNDIIDAPHHLSQLCVPLPHLPYHPSYRKLYRAISLC